MTNISNQSEPIRRLEPCRIPGILFRKTLLMVGAGLSIIITGCGSHDDHHEDEHLEHFVPAHKPADYTALVEQLEKRIAPMLPASGSRNGDAASGQSSTERQELIDIIGWIPELAADSELRKRDFETAVSAGVRLNIALGFDRATEGTAPADQSLVPDLLHELKALVSKSQTSTEPM